MNFEQIDRLLIDQIEAEYASVIEDDNTDKLAAFYMYGECNCADGTRRKVYTNSFLYYDTVGGTGYCNHIGEYVRGRWLICRYSSGGPCAAVRGDADRDPVLGLYIEKCT